MIKKALSIVIACTTLVVANANAQTTSGQQDYTSGFTGIEIGDYFHANVKVADYYGVEWTIENDLKDSMHIYVRDGILVASVDRKTLDSNTKKKYLGKKANDAVISVTVFAPSLSSITALENSVIDMSALPINTDNMIVKADDDAKINSLSATASAITISASKKSVVNATVEVGNLSVNSMNSAVVRVDHNSKNMSLQVNGTSDVYVVGDCHTVDITALNSSKLRLDGTAAIMNLTASSREVHAENFKVNDVAVVGSNACKVYINVSDNLSLDLKGASLVSYSGAPAVDIVNIQNSSVSRAKF